MNDTKKCNKCLNIKSLDLFSNDRNKKDGKRTICKYCTQETANSSQGREKQRLRKLETARDNPRYYLYWNAKARAKRKNVPFTISLDDITLPDYCPILGIKLENNRFKVQSNSYTLDRIIPRLGYTRDNIMVISHLANTMKSSADPETLKRFAEWVLKYFANS